MIPGHLLRLDPPEPSANGVLFREGEIIKVLGFSLTVTNCIIGLFFELILSVNFILIPNRFGEPDWADRIPLRLLLSIDEPLLTESEVHVHDLSVEPGNVTVLTADDQFNVVFDGDMGYGELQTLELTILMVLDESDCFTFLTAVTEVHVRPYTLNVLVTDRLHYVGFVAHEIVRCKCVLVDVQKYSKSPVT